ncbi:MAG: hypothetical protein IMW99_02265 [Firmicutes bacterium]|nr:hypothetical protein [Bacillota bacterium]
MKMKRRCAAVQAALTDFWYGEMDSLAPALSAHWRACPECQAFWEDLQALRHAPDAPRSQTGGGRAGGRQAGSGAAAQGWGPAGGPGAFSRLAPPEQAMILAILDRAESLRQQRAQKRRQILDNVSFALLCAAVLSLHALVWWRWGSQGLLAAQMLLYSLMPWTLVLFSTGGPDGPDGPDGPGGPAVPDATPVKRR